MEKQAIQLRPNIFEYEDYREYLRDLYSFYKETTTFFSYRYFSKRAGFSSPNYLKLVIDKKRNISSKSIIKFSEALRLTKKESDFFEKLVNFNQAANSTQRAACALRIVKTKSLNRTKSLEGSSLQYYSSWTNIAIRELVGTVDFKYDLDWIAQKFDPVLKTSHIENSLECLLHLGLIEKTASGGIVQSEKNLKTKSEVASSLVAQYHRDMMKKASDSIEEFGREQREISSVSIPLSKSTFEEIKKRVQDFRQEIISLASEDTSPEEVYQINFQLFPLTKKAPSK